MASMRELVARRDAAKTELQQLIDKYPDVLPPDVETRASELEDELKRLGTAERRQALLDDLDRNARGHQLTGPSGDDRLDAEIAKTGLLDVVRAQLPGTTDHAAGRAREVSQELARRNGREPQGMYWSMREQRVLTTSATGDKIIGTDYRPDLFIDVLRATPRVRQLGATVLGGLIGNVTIPKKLTGTTTQWVAENSAITASDMTFGNVTLSPHHCGVLTEYSRNMILQSSPDIEQLARSDMSNNLANALDIAAIKGGGAPAPTGLLNLGITTAGWDSPGSYYDVLAGMVGTVQSANADGGRMGWYITPTSTRTSLLKVKDKNERPYGLDVLLQGLPAQFSNTVSGDSPDVKAIIYGDWTSLLIAFWSELDILVNPFDSTAYPKGNVMVRAMLSADVAVRHIESFVACTTAA